MINRNAVCFKQKEAWFEVDDSRILTFLQYKEGVNLAEADTIVSGGKGMGSAENFKLIEDLAEALDGEVGASRDAVEEHWIAYPHQVGQSGKTVRPKLYMACGIAGAIQHVAGMRDSGLILAINKDPKAQIFKVADYSIVADVKEIIPVLTKKLKHAKEKDSG